MSFLLGEASKFKSLHYKRNHLIKLPLQTPTLNTCHHLPVLNPAQPHIRIGFYELGFLKPPHKMNSCFFPSNFVTDLEKNSIYQFLLKELSQM
jgi:hypothetical protein